MFAFISETYAIVDVLTISLLKFRFIYKYTTYTGRTATSSDCDPSSLCVVTVSQEITVTTQL